jgi:NAD(P)H dehydrogenase (quinone)
MDPERHHGRRYRPTGPKLLSGRDMAAVIQKVVGHAVIPVNLPFWMFLKAARMTGADIHEIYNYREYMRDHQGGAFSLGGGVTEVVEALTGAPAEDFDTTARRYAALPFAQQTFSNRLAAIARFNLLPFYPGHDLAAYERRMRFPRPVDASLSSSDARWLSDHGGDSATGLSPQPRNGWSEATAPKPSRAGEFA